jgi:sigma-E factor negative regulatory protein RseA
MNDRIHEQLSALMDGELERDETRFLLKRLASDHELPLRWSRYHVVRQTLRHQQGPALPLDFAARVMHRIDDEAVVRGAAGAPWLRWGAGGAIAASVAVAALVLTRPAIDQGGGGLATTRTASLQVAPINVAPVAATSSSSDFRPPLLAPNAPVETAPVSFGSDLSQPLAGDPRLQTYFSRHYQAVGGGGQSAFVPYVLLGAPQRDMSAAQPDQQAAPQKR